MCMGYYVFLSDDSDMILYKCNQDIYSVVTLVIIAYILEIATQRLVFRWCVEHQYLFM